MPQSFEEQVIERLEAIDNALLQIVKKLGGKAPERETVEQTDGPLTDESPMPFGKHTGTKMGKLPRDYIEWLMDLDEIKNKKVREYIECKKRGGKHLAVQDTLGVSDNASEDHNTSDDDVPF